MTTATITRQAKKVLRPLYPNLTMKDKYKLYDINTIGYLDIESSGLTADFDIMLSYAILVRNITTERTVILSGVVNQKDFELARKEENADLIDKRIMENLIHDIEGIDTLIGHWFVGKHRHDMPFIRTRCAINNIQGLPKHKQVRYGDTQKWGSALYRNHNNSLDTLAKMFNVRTKKTNLDRKQWVNACIGVKSALDYILTHNIHDVKITYQVHKGLEEYVPIPSTYY